MSLQYSYRAHDRVSTKATNFDRGPDYKWCKSVFGENYLTALCYGTITNLNGSVATVLWDLDNKKAKIDIKLLKKHGK